MKKAALFLLCLVFASSSQAQGYFEGPGYNFAFDNLNSTAAITVATANAGPSEGLPGYFVGTGYTASLYWGPASATRFDQLTLFPHADTVFFGAGIADPDQTNGAGYFDGGDIVLPTTDYYIQAAVAVWWNGPGANGVATSYAQAQADGYNTGQSPILTVPLAYGLEFPEDLYNLASFQVGVVPEPATLTLCGLGAAALLCLRRNIIL
jgi:hypothetical protein